MYEQTTLLQAIIRLAGENHPFRSQLAAAGIEDAGTPQEVKARLGERLGADFSGIRFHTDAAAARTADGMGARAYAAGRDIYFGEGGFDPAVAAHELVHTIQQGQVGSSAQTVSAPAGSVQMKPKIFQTVGSGLKKLGSGIVQGAQTIGRGVAHGAAVVGQGLIQGSKTVVHGASTLGRAVGHGASALGRAVGHGVAQGAKTVGHGVSALGRAVGHGVAQGARTIGHSVAKAATGFWEFAGGKMGFLSPSNAQRDEAMTRAQSGDYSQFATLRKEDAQALVDEKKDDIRANYSSSLAQMQQASTSEMLNPVTRKSMSQLARDKSLPAHQRQQIRDAAEAMDQQMIVNTMKKASPAQEARMVQHYQIMEDQRRLAREYARSKSGKTYLGGEGDGTLLGGVEARKQALANAQSGNTRTAQDAQQLAQADLQRGQKSGDALLRLMFMMQLGNFQRTDASGETETQREWDQTMANAFSHGGRTGFVFAGQDREADGKDTGDVFDAIFGANEGKDAGVHVRAAGTHHMVTPKVSQGLKGYKEQGGIGAAISSKMDRHYQHFGMDMGIGGVGSEGTAGEGGQAQVINADGRSGHLYIGRRTGTAGKKGGLLVGLESDSPYRMNQTGHMHNAAAQAEEGSSTGGLKVDIQGKKYGGRTVDLSGLTNQELVATLGAFTSHFTSLRDSDESSCNALLEQISGKRMGDDSMNALLGQMLQGEENAELLAKLQRMRQGFGQ